MIKEIFKDVPNDLFVIKGSYILNRTVKNFRDYSDIDIMTSHKNMNIIMKITGLDFIPMGGDEYQGPDLFESKQEFEGKKIQVFIDKNEGRGAKDEKDKYIIIDGFFAQHPQDVIDGKIQTIGHGTEKEKKNIEDLFFLLKSGFVKGKFTVINKDISIYSTIKEFDLPF